MEEDIDKLKQKMEELLRSYSQSLRARAGHPSACNEESEHHQKRRKWRDCITRTRQSNKVSAQTYYSAKIHMRSGKACRIERTA